MFYCEQCDKLTEQKETQHKKTIMTRDKEYHYVVKKTGVVVEDRKRTYRLGKDDVEKDTFGSEIVKEINICGDCAGVKKQERFNKVTQVI